MNITARAQLFYSKLEINFKEPIIPIMKNNWAILEKSSKME